MDNLKEELAKIQNRLYDREITIAESLQLQLALFESYVKACKPEKVADNIGSSSSDTNWGKRLGYNEGVDEYEKALFGGK